MRPVFTYETQWYLEPKEGKFAGQVLKISEDTEFEPESDTSTYDPTYKDRANQPSYVTGRKFSISYSIDHMIGNDLQEFLYAIEDRYNFPITLYRVDEFEAATTVPADWKASTKYAIGDRVHDKKKIYEATKAGTSNSSAPTWKDEGDITDSDVTWKYVGAAPEKKEGFRAKKWEAVITPNPISGEASEPNKHTGTISMTSADPELGVFENANKKFTAFVAK